MRGRDCFGVLALALAIGVGAAPANARAAIDRALLEAFVDGSVAEGMQDDHIAGMSVAVVADGEVLLAKGYGQAGADPYRAADADTLFRVGSISKTFTWIALMQLVERGKLTLDDPVNDHLPEALRVPDDGFTDPIRVRHLMTHSAGFEDSVFGHLFTKDPERILPAAEYLVRYRVRRVRAPGSLAVYSNYSATLAGALVAHVSGQPWEEHAEQRIMRPLAMQSATFREPYPGEVAAARALPAPMPADLAARLSQGFQLVAAKLEPQSTEYVGPMAAAGSVSASATDMATYMLALIDPARLERAGVLRAETALRMREPLHSNLEGFGPIRHGFLDYRLPGCKLALGHDGGLTLAHARMVVCPDLGIGVFLAFNTPGGSNLHGGLAASIVGHFLGGTLAAEPVYGPDAPARAAALAGTYLGLRRAYHRTERGIMALVPRRISATPEGDLLLPGFFGDAPLRLRPSGDDRYQTEDGRLEYAIREVDGHLRAFDSSGVMPNDRMGFVAGPDGLRAAIALGQLAALVGSLAFVRGLASSRARSLPGHAASLALDFGALVWMLAFGALWVGVVRAIQDAGAIIYHYPGVLRVACNGFLLAAIVTAGAVGAVAFFVRPTGWSRLRFARHGVALVAFALCTLALGYWGLLGFSGW